MSDQDLSSRLCEQVCAALDAQRPLRIQGGGSKSFYGRTPSGDLLEVAGHRGVTHYAPTELVLSARAGTPLADIEQLLREQRQMLAFEPPHYGEGATLGGTIACNFSGPRRAWAGAARDFVLGCRVINGRGEVLSFGGEVMKNVAGYDVSRLMCGAMGTLGVLLEVSLKVLPMPETEISVCLQISEQEALRQWRAWARQPLPVTALCHDGNQCYVRLSGTAGAVDAAARRIGGERLAENDRFWARLREQRHAFFDSARPLWRLSLAAPTPALPLAGKWLYEWGGALRWLVSDTSAESIRSAIRPAGGHATLFRRGDRDQAVFQPLPAGLMRVQQKLKQAFDPHGILNPGRLYPDF